MASNSTVKHRKNKPTRPDGFPLFAHASGRWCKKIKGRFHYFGPWSDPDAALAKWLDEKDDLLAGRTPRKSSDGLQLRDLCNQFLSSKRHLVDTRELSPRSFRDYHDTCARIVDAFGRSRLVDDLVAGDFEKLRSSLSSTRGPVALGNEIQRIRSIFKYGYEAGLIEKPVRFGPGFKKPNRRTIRQARQADGPRMFEADELRTIIDAAPQPLKAMILLGINAGFGQSDIGCLLIDTVDLENGWCDHPRPKTAVQRRCKLWPETVTAIREVQECRRPPRDDADCDIAFLTTQGRRWSRVTASGSPVDCLGHEFAKLLRRLGLKRAKVNFYALRHTTETIGGESKDQVAVDHVMGHVRDDMASLYRERISDERLQAVTDTVHHWLFGEKGGSHE